MTDIPPDDVPDPEWDKPLTEEQWRAVRWLFEDDSPEKPQRGGL